jgi:tRNA pseudouridine55 synthase
MDQQLKLEYRTDQGMLLLIDKPLEWTSFDVVNKLRFAFRKKLGIKKIKVGHAGTLDPLATGLLIIAVGRMTKKIQNLTLLSKTYQGIMKFGMSTPSYDSETEPDHYFTTKHINLSSIQKTIEEFTGAIEQEVPKYSALKVSGKKLYKYARQNQEVILPKREVIIHAFNIINYSADDQCLSFEISCSKGTYIRSIAHEFGKALNSGAYLKELKRTSIGSYHLEDALSIDDAVTLISNMKVMGDE